MLMAKNAVLFQGNRCDNSVCLELKLYPEYSHSTAIKKLSINEGYPRDFASTLNSYTSTYMSEMSL